MSRILFPPCLSAPTGDDHPSRRTIAGRLKQLTLELGRAPSIVRAGTPRERGAPSCLAPGGVYRAAAVTCGAGALLPHLFTLTGSGRGGRTDPAAAIVPAVCFLWHCPAGRPGLPLATTVPCGVRTFLGAGPGSPRGALVPVPRPSGRLAHVGDFTARALRRSRPRRPPPPRARGRGRSTATSGEGSGSVHRHLGRAAGFGPPGSSRPLLPQVRGVVDQGDRGRAVGVELGDGQRR